MPDCLDGRSRPKVRKAETRAAKKHKPAPRPGSRPQGRLDFVCPHRGGRRAAAEEGRAYLTFWMTAFMASSLLFSMFERVMDSCCCS